MTSLIECLVHPECADKVRTAQGRYTTAMARYEGWKMDVDPTGQRATRLVGLPEPTKYDSWTVHASSGDHVVENAADVADAFYQFRFSHPDDFVHGVTVVTDDGHSILCRSHITGENESRCNCK